MKPAYKGALLSAFVCPGAGQIFFKRYVRGVIMIMIVIICLGIIIHEAVNAYLAILYEMAANGEIITLETITRLVFGKSFLSLINPPVYFWVMFLGCWFFSIMDAYFIGLNPNRKSPD
jgi:hypothetical protein